MRRAVLYLAVAAVLACGWASALAQTPSQAGAPAAQAPAAPATEKTVEQTASPELVGQLVNELAITPVQAEGAAGALFGVAKTKLSVADFAKVAAAVPNMEGLLKAAPAATGKASATDIAMASLGGAAKAASALSKLGLKPQTIAKLAPTLVKAVQSKGGAEVAALLAGALK